MAEILAAGFAGHWPAAWPDVSAAQEEVAEFLAEDRICRLAVAGDDRVVGWIGAIREYDGHAWELHPLVVHPDYQGQGIGRALVVDLEERVRERGASTLYLGSDDEDDMTSLSGVDLYQDLWRHLAEIKNFKNHPYSFYQKMGFAIVGVIPDANGPGKPDIIMAKRVG